MATITMTEELDVRRCPNCHMSYAAPQAFFTRMLEQHNRGEKAHWYCPAGHSIIYLGESDLDVVRRERDILKQQAARLVEDAAVANRKRLAAEKTLKSQTKRVVAGVCPCCHRTFKQLAAHMKTKHPDVVKLEVA